MCVSNDFDCVHQSESSAVATLASFWACVELQTGETRQQQTGKATAVQWPSPIHTLVPHPVYPKQNFIFCFVIVITFFGIWFHFECARECQLIWDWWTACAIGRGERPQERSAPALATCCLIGLFSHKSTRCNWFCCCSCAAFE